MTEHPKFCGRCGTPMNGGRFCGNCGWSGAADGAAVPAVGEPLGPSPADPVDAPVTAPVPVAPADNEPFAPVADEAAAPAVSIDEPEAQGRADAPTETVVTEPVVTEPVVTEPIAPEPQYVAPVAARSADGGSPQGEAVDWATDYDGASAPAVDEPERRQSRTPLLAAGALALLLLLAGGGYWAAHRGDDTTTSTAQSSPTVQSTESTSVSPTETSSAGASGASPSGSGSATSAASSASTDQAAAEAKALNALLVRSGQQRTKLQTAVKCTTPIGTSQAYMAQVVSGRQSLLQDLNSMDLSDLPGGSEMQNNLTEAWNHSLKADQDFQEWANGRNQWTGCNTDSSYWTDAATESQQSQVYKKDFMAAWNPIAKKYNLTQLNAGNF